MNPHNSVHVKLSNSQLNKLNSKTKLGNEITFYKI